MSGCVASPILYSATVVGTPITNAQLPTSKLRRVYDQGPQLLNCLNARTEDNLDYFYDASKFLEPGEVITSAFASVQQSLLVCTMLTFAPSGVVTWLAGGGDQVMQQVMMTFRTSLGKSKNVQWNLLTVGPPLATTVTVTPPVIIVVGST